MASRKRPRNIRPGDEEAATLLNQNEDNNSVTEWDVFEESKGREESNSMKQNKLLNIGVKFIKFLSYISTFLFVLGFGIISKGTLLFMTSQLKAKKQTPHCNIDIARNKQLVSFLPDEERFAWMWCIFIAFAVPEVIVFSKSLYLYHKDKKVDLDIQEQNPNKKKKSVFNESNLRFCLVSLMETLHVIGLAILFYIILPELDVVKGAMLTNCMCFIPAVLSLLSRHEVATSITSRTETESGKNEQTRISQEDLSCFDVYKTQIKRVLDLLALSAQATGFVVWPLLEGKPELWMIPISALFISCGWWENYLSEQSNIRIVRYLATLKKRTSEYKNSTNLIISMHKVAMFFCSILVILLVTGEDVHNFFALLPKSFGRHNINIHEIVPELDDMAALVTNSPISSVPAHFSTPIYVVLIQISCSFLCYFFSKFACRSLIQGFSYALPVNLVVPAVITLLIAACGIRNGDPCSFHGFLPDYLFFATPPVYNLLDFISTQMASIWILWLLSQTWVTVHIWNAECRPAANAEDIFFSPLYNGLLLDQSLGMNRIRSDKIIPEEVLKDHVPKIYACATMWKETKEEMIQLLSSILRLDDEYKARENAHEYIRKIRRRFKIETHIFFDDAFENSEPCDIQEKVKTLVKALPEAVEEVHNVAHPLLEPKVSETPYGGRITWVLPRKSLLIVHLKDNRKIRNKKRWSQVMYMYYLLGHKLLGKESGGGRRNEGNIGEKIIEQERITFRIENTYILALDGDIDFQPKAVLSLVDLMQGKLDVGAACGRIHPVGSGPMVWYQKFEYAIGHWLQKATEHVIGCVLCSPGCFSLFRAGALMSKNVMRKYATESEKATDFVQYDQGEDRWLCTLLLQQGFRVEYSAASDAYTNSPDGFKEFYNQRRRWIPSTMANILDLLTNSGKAMKINKSLSFLYIVYQVVLMASTVLGPGTIFLMLIGAFVSAFKIDNWLSFWYNVIPIVIFMAVCFFCKEDVQLFFARIISAVYGLVMIAVLVGLILQINEDGVLAPSSLFFFIVAGEIIATGFLHPAEIGCLPCGVIYYVTVPSMYMLLIIYSIFNMNNSSWGTRVTPEEEAGNEDKKNLRKSKDKKFGIFSDIQEEVEGSLEISCAGLFTCMFCTHKKQNQAVKEQPQASEDGSPNEEAAAAVAPPNPSKQHWLNNFMRRPEKLSDKELVFWKEMISTYLQPIVLKVEDEKKKDQILKDLRDKCVFGFLMLNSLFVFFVFLLQINVSIIHLRWPLGMKTTISFDDDQSVIHITRNYLRLEPIGFVFLIFFALLLLIQFTAMLFHRFETFVHIMAQTSLNVCSSETMDRDDQKDEELAVDIARQVQRYDREDKSSGPDILKRKKMLSELEKVEVRRKSQHQLLAEEETSNGFVKGLQKFRNKMTGRGLKKMGLPRKTLQLLDDSEIKRRSANPIMDSNESTQPAGFQVVNFDKYEGEDNDGFDGEEDTPVEPVAGPSSAP